MIGCWSCHPSALQISDASGLEGGYACGLRGLGVWGELCLGLGQNDAWGLWGTYAWGLGKVTLEACGELRFFQQQKCC